MKASRFKGKKGQTLHILAPERSKLGRVLLIGLGKPKDLDDQVWQRAGGAALLATRLRDGVYFGVEGFDRKNPL